MTPLEPEDRAALIEQVVSAHRARSVDGRVQGSPAFHDLEAADRVAAFDATLEARRLEAAIDRDGRSTTVLAVLRVIRGGAGGR